MAHTIPTKLTSASSTAAKFLGVFGKVRRLTVICMNKLVIWQERAEQRQALAELDSRMLKDIGISAAEAYKEMRKPFWLA